MTMLPKISNQPIKLSIYQFQIIIWQKNTGWEKKNILEYSISFWEIESLLEGP